MDRHFEPDRWTSGHDKNGCWACMLNCIDAMAAALQFIGDTKDPNDSAYAVAEQLRKAIKEAQGDE